MSRFTAQFSQKALDDLNEHEFDHLTLWGALLEDDEEDYDDLEPLPYPLPISDEMRIETESTNVISLLARRANARG